MTDFFIAISFASGLFAGFVLGVFRCLYVDDQMRKEKIEEEIEEKSRFCVRAQPHEGDRTAWVFFCPHHAMGETWIVLSNDKGVHDAIRCIEKCTKLPGGGVYHIGNGRRTWIDTGEFVGEVA